MTAFRWFLGALFASTVVAIGTGQTTPAPKPTGIISGRVVAAGSTTPLVGAIVKLLNLEPPAGTKAVVVTQETNARGEFMFPDLAPGRYQLTADKPRHLSVTYGQIRPGAGGPGVSIRLASGQRVENLLIPMPLAGVITGVVTDIRGEPVQGAGVKIWRYDWVAGERILREYGQDAVDDRGWYRIPGVRPGEYLVSAFPMWDGNPPRPAGIFYPGTPVVSLARPIAVTAGEEKTGIDIQVRLVFLASVSGTIVGSTGRPFEYARVVAVDVSTSAPVPALSPFGTYSVAVTGAFTIGNLPPGQYRLMTNARENSAGADPVFWAMADVSVDDRDLKDVTLTLQRGGTLSGKIVFDPVKPRVTTDWIASLQPLDAGRQRLFIPSGRVDAAGQFTITGIMPGRYASSFVRLPDGVSIQSMRIAGRDVYDLAIDIGPSEDVRGLEVTLTDRRTSIAGTLLDASGMPTPDYLVIVFPAEEKYWLPGTRRIRTVRPSSDGQYVFRDLPAGSYRLAALTDAEPDEWFAAAFLRKIAPASIAITIAEGEAKTMDVRIR